MNKKLKLALASLLGFSAACSSVKPSTGRASEPHEAIGVEVRSDTTHYRVVAMYGVRSPRRPSGIDPVAERPVDSLDVKLPSDSANRADE